MAESVYICGNCGMSAMPEPSTAVAPVGAGALQSELGQFSQPQSAPVEPVQSPARAELVRGDVNLDGPPRSDELSQTGKGLSKVITVLAGPIMTAPDQPPAPGSNGMVRLWHWLRNLAAKVFGAVPQHATVPWLVVRAALVLVLWAAILFVVMEVFLYWAIFELFRRHRAKPGPAAGVPQPVAAAPTFPPPLGAPMSALADRQIFLERLKTAPDPTAEAAVDRCPTCGASTSKAVDTCRYCRGRLPVVVKRGWHIDPFAMDERRWFDGSHWTEHTSHSA